MQQHYEARLIGNCWFLVDLATGQTTYCRSRAEAEDRAWRYSSLLDVVQARRRAEEAIFQRLLAERQKLEVQTRPPASPQIPVEQLTTA